METCCRVLYRASISSDLHSKRTALAAGLKIDGGRGRGQGRKLLPHYFWLSPGGGSGGGEKWSDSECGLKGELLGCPGGLDVDGVWVRKKGAKAGAKVFSVRTGKAGGKLWEEKWSTVGHAEFVMHFGDPRVIQSRQSGT